MIERFHRECDANPVLVPITSSKEIIEAKKQGKAKNLGITAHTTRAAVDAIDGFDFDTVMFPINFVELTTIGIKMTVKPHVNRDDRVTLDLSPPLLLAAILGGGVAVAEAPAMVGENPDECMATGQALVQAGYLTAEQLSNLLQDANGDLFRFSEYAITRNGVGRNELANAVGAYACTKPGAIPALPTRAEVEHFLKQF